ncbi:hypothetical protein [Paraglaciecola sp.]
MGALLNQVRIQQPELGEIMKTSLPVDIANGETELSVVLDDAPAAN